MKECPVLFELRPADLTRVQGLLGQRNVSLRTDPLGGCVIDFMLYMVFVIGGLCRESGDSKFHSKDLTCLQ